MRNFKYIFLLTILFLSTNLVEAQGVFHILNGLRGVRGDRSLEVIKPRIGDVEITDLYSLKDIPGIKPERYVWYKGITAYNPTNFSNNKVKIEKDFYTWDGGKWVKTYSSTPTGSFKGDLQALYNIVHHPKNKSADRKGFHSWNIDLENINNPENLNLSGVFFRKINGEYRVLELNLEDFYFQDITLTEGLEALASCRVYYNDFLKEINIKLPSLIHFVYENNDRLAKVNLNCPNLASIQSKGNKSEISLNTSKCPKLSFLSVTNGGMSVLDVSANSELNYLLCNDNFLTELNLSNNKKLIFLNCIANSLTSLNLSYNTALKELHCSNNKIESLDVSKNRALKKMGCSYNSLNYLDLANNLDLDELWCNFNRLTTLDLSNNVNLANLECSQNMQLSVLNISNCTQLRSLKCAENKLTKLDLSRLTNLEKLDIYRSELMNHSKSVKICSKTLEKISITPSFASSSQNRGIYEIIDCK